jgi:hypothetical protein
MLIKELILFCYIFKNIHTFAEIKTQKTMYQVHIKNGIEAEVHNYDSLRKANRYVIEKAWEMGLEYNYDADGWAFAHTGEDYSPARTEIFIFQII